MKYFAEMFKRTFDFYGKSNLRQYWMAVLMYIVFGFFVELISMFFVMDFNLMMQVFTALLGLYELILFLPMLSLTIRRLHDTGRSGYWILLALLPIVGSLLLLCLLCQKSYVEQKINFWITPKQDNLD